MESPPLEVIKTRADTTLSNHAGQASSRGDWTRGFLEVPSNLSQSMIPLPLETRLSGILLNFYHSVPTNSLLSGSRTHTLSTACCFMDSLMQGG